MSVDKRLARSKGLNTVATKIEEAALTINNAREAGYQWRKKLTTLKEEMVGIAAKAYNLGDPAARKRADQLDTEIRQAEYAITGLASDKAAAKAVLAELLTEQEKLANITVEKQLANTQKKLDEMVSEAQGLLLEFGKASLEIQKLARESEILATDYGVLSQLVRWPTVSRPLREWLMVILGRQYANVIVDTSRRAEHKYQDQVAQAMAEGTGSEIVRLVEEVKGLSVRTAKEKRIRDYALGVSNKTDAPVEEVVNERPIPQADNFIPADFAGDESGGMEVLQEAMNVSNS